MTCSCPDWADLCKHLAAVLYGVGARLDDRPELLFQLRGVDPQELITADLDLTRTAEGKGKRRRLDEEDLSGLFGVEIAGEPMPAPRRPKAAALRTAGPAVTAPAPAPRVAPKASAKPAMPKPSGFVITGPAVVALRKRMGLNKTEFARLVGVSSTSVAAWEKQEGRLNLSDLPLRSMQRVVGMTQGEVAEALEQKRR